jgi:hypothetical protein
VQDSGFAFRRKWFRKKHEIAENKTIFRQKAVKNLLLTLEEEKTEEIKMQADSKWDSTTTFNEEGNKGNLEENSEDPSCPPAHRLSFT